MKLRNTALTTDRNMHARMHARMHACTYVCVSLPWCFTKTPRRRDIGTRRHRDKSQGTQRHRDTEMSCMRFFKQRKHLQIRDFHGHKERRKFAQKNTRRRHHFCKAVTDWLAVRSRSQEILRKLGEPEPIRRCQRLAR